MENGIELPQSAVHASIDLNRLEERIERARNLSEAMSKTADYARQVAKNGSWTGEITIQNPSGFGGYYPIEREVRGTEFIPIREGITVAVRETHSRIHETLTAHSLLIQYGDSEPEVLASVEGGLIEIPGVDSLRIEDLGALRGVLDYIAEQEQSDRTQAG